MILDDFSACSWSYFNRRFTSLRWASVAAHAHPWKVHYGQQHVFSTFVFLCMLSAEETGAAVAAVAADTGSGRLHTSQGQTGGSLRAITTGFSEVPSARPAKLMT